jgi:hypothetical protein
MPRDPDKPISFPQKLSPEDPAARDEGPRLLPLRERRAKPRQLATDERYLELADIAIQRKKRGK